MKMKEIKSTADLRDVLQNIDLIVAWLFEEDIISEDESDRIMESTNTIGTLLLEGSVISNDSFFTHKAIKEESRAWEEQMKER